MSSQLRADSSNDDTKAPRLLAANHHVLWRAGSATEAMEAECEEPPGQEDAIEDDVFSEQAVDLSPVNRHPPTPLLSGNLDLASRRMASLSKISQALMRNSGMSS